MGVRRVSTDAQQNRAPSPVSALIQAAIREYNQQMRRINGQ